MSKRAPLKITFGVELEVFWRVSKLEYESLMLRTSYSSTGKGECEGTKAVFVLHEVSQPLSAGGLPVYLKDHKIDLFDQFDKWTVMLEEIGAIPELGPDERQVDIEVVSRILTFDKEGFDEVMTAVRVLNEFQPPFGHSKWTSLHVHVGANRKYDLLWLKKFTQLVTAFEHEIERLHPDYRTHEASGEVNWYCQPPSSSPGLRAGEGPLISMSVIESQEDLPSLRELFNPNEKCAAYNISNIYDVGDDNSNTKHTIEFRQHKGTSDAEEIFNWITVCCALVNYTYYADPTELLNYCRSHVQYWPDEPSDSIFDLMKTIGIQHLIPYYHTKADFDRPRRAISEMPASIRFCRGLHDGLFGDVGINEPPESPPSVPTEQGDHDGDLIDKF